MDNIVFDLAKECRDVIAESAKKNQYSGTPVEDALKRLVPAMLQDASYEERQLFYRMLRTTPILVIPEGLKYTHKALVDSIFRDVNTNVEVLEHEKDSYGKMAGDASFISRPFFGKNGQILGVLKFIYIKMDNDLSSLVAKSLNEELTDPNDILRMNRFILYRTPINVRQLEHELGHAWVSEDNPYTIVGNTLIERVGTGKIYYDIGQNDSGKFTIRERHSDGILTEEMLNTGMEFDAIASFLGISREELQNLYNSGKLLPSVYQGEMLPICEVLRNSKLRQVIRDWRFRGSQEAIDRLNQLMEKSPIYIHRTTDREDESDVAQIFRESDANGVVEFCEQNQRDFLVDKGEMTPLQLFNIAIKQGFDVSSYRMMGGKMSDDIYKRLIKPAIITARGLIEEALRAVEQEKKNEKDDKNIAE